MSIDRVFKLAEARGSGGNLELRVQQRACGDATHKWNATLVRLDAQHNQQVEQQSGETPERAIANVTPTKLALRAQNKKRPKFPGFPTIGPDQCGVRLYYKRKFAMVCTHKKDHSDARSKEVHDMIIDGTWWGGWVDRVSQPDEDFQQWPPAPNGREAEK